MNSLVKVIPNVKKFKSYLFDVNKNVNPMMLSGLTDTAKSHLAYATGFYAEKPICIITYNEMQAKKLLKDLEFFAEDVKFFPKREIINFDYLAESKEILNQRIDVLNHIINGKAKVIVTTIEAACQKMISKENLYKNKLLVKVGDNLNLEELKEKLILLGFERYEITEGKGQFSIRGGIIDIAVSDKKGVRIELWGDEIDSIRYFNISSQRSTEMMQEIEIYPAYEFLLEKDLKTISENIQNKNNNSIFKEIVENDIELIESGEYINKIDKYFNSFYEEQNTLLDYLGEQFIIFLDECSKIKARIENIKKDNASIVKDLVEKKKFVPDSLTILDDYLQFSEKIINKQAIYLEKQDIGFVDKQSMHAKRNGYSFSYREVNFFRSSMDLLFEELQEATKRNKQTIILGRKPRK